MRKFIIAAIVVSLCFVNAFAAAVPSYVTIGNSGANVVTINMGKGMGAELTLADNSVNKDMDVSYHISGEKSATTGSLVASVNGGYFNAYYNRNATLSYPSNCARVYATLVRNGLVINAGGSAPMLGFTSDGRALIDRVDVKTFIKFPKGDVYPWGVNNYFADASAVVLFTGELGYSVALPTSAVIVHISNSVVTRLQYGGSLTVAKGTYAVVYQSKAWENALKWESAPKVGDKAVVSSSFTPSQSENQDAWNNITTAVGAGPWLLSRGVDVTAENTEFKEDKMGVDFVAARSFAAVMPDGRLMLGAATASPKQIANYLISIGARDGMLLDGGASSMLYVEGKGYLRNAGRKLSNVLHIVDYDSTPAHAIPSSWAAADVDAAIKLSIVPGELQKYYRNVINRQEFCMLTYQMLTKATDVNSLLAASSISYSEASSAFTDTKDESVLACYRLGIVNGMGNNKFGGNLPLTREQAAKMLKIVGEALNLKATGSVTEFGDSARISSWAVPGVEYVLKTGVMQGKGANFDPLGQFTREQAILTVYRMMD